MHKTVLVKLKIQDSDKKRLIQTFTDYKTAWQTVSEYVFKNNCPSRYLASIYPLG